MAPRKYKRKPRKRMQMSRAIIPTMAPRVRAQNTITCNLSLVSNLVSASGGASVVAHFRANSLRNTYKEDQTDSNAFGNMLPLTNQQKFKDLFDEYRVNSIKLTYYPTYNSAEYDRSTVNTNIPTVAIAYDSDNVTLASPRQIVSTSGHKVRSLLKPFTLTFRNKLVVPGGTPIGSQAGIGGFINAQGDSTDDSNTLGGVFIASLQGVDPPTAKGFSFGIIRAVYNVTFRGRQDSNPGALYDVDDTAEGFPKNP